MNIGFIAPQSIAAVNGGVRTQALMTAKHLKDLGVNISFVSPWEHLSSKKIDAFHVFTASPENSGIVSRLHEEGRKIILSPVLFSNRSPSKIATFLKFESAFSKLNKGIRSEFSIKKDICKKADLILPNTNDEAHLIETGFDISGKKIQVIPNGVESRFANSDPSLFKEQTGLSNFVLFSGQASAERKNVLKLIKSFDELDMNLVIIGDFSNSEYSKECIKLANKIESIHLMDTLAHDSDLLSSAYAACSVFVLPSQFETPGIAALEAALAGANIVITEVGGTRDYFKNFAEYVSPYSDRSISKGIQSAFEKAPSDDLKNHILENYTWDIVAKKTLNQYEKVLS